MWPQRWITGPAQGPAHLVALKRQPCRTHALQLPNPTAVHTPVEQKTLYSALASVLMVAAMGLRLV